MGNEAWSREPGANSGFFSILLVGWGGVVVGVFLAAQGVSGAATMPPQGTNGESSRRALTIERVVAQVQEAQAAREGAIRKAVDVLRAASEKSPEPGWNPWPSREQEPLQEPRSPVHDAKAPPTGGVMERVNRAMAPVTVSGEVRAAAGMTRDDLILQEANGDLNERNFRIFSGPLRYNTFDPRVFSRLKVNVETPSDGWQFHSNITVDPWSFVGTTERLRAVGDGGDALDVELKWWSATNTAINETVYTSLNGDSVALPEIETSEGRTIPTSVSSIFGNTFRLQSMDIDYAFQPIRSLWAGYRSEMLDLRVFPFGAEAQALSSDDPLGLSNHHIYWEPSPWLDEWLPGRLNVGATPDDFTRGRWSDDLSFFTRDSDLTRLTALRGASLQWHPTEATTLQTALASPKGLWQEFGSLDSFLGMTRLKHAWWDGRASLGGLYTTRVGFVERRRDATNHVYALDGSIKPLESTTVAVQGATSHSIQDRRQLERDDRGWAWHGAVTTAWWGERLTSRLFYTHMDEGFDPGLASYRQTRQDQFWGRHLKFKPRLKVLGAIKPLGALTWEDVEGSRIGDGVDIGRDAFGVRLNGRWWEGRVEPLFDVRNVHTTDGKYLETVVRNENTVRPTSWLTAKTLVIYHDLPDTIAGIDPLQISSDTDRPFDNTAIVDDRDPSLQTYSLGGALFPEEPFSVWAAWERTNDTTIGTGNFPRGLLDGASFATRIEEGSVIRFPTNFLFGQGFFPQPPYPFFDIYRAGVSYAPWERLELSFDWTRNEFEYAGQIDDNLNHIGLAAAWSPLDSLTLAGQYVASWAIDVTTTNAGGGNKLRAHHNFWGWVVWSPDEASQFSLEYGISAVGAPTILFSVDPEGGFYPTLDTEHLLRLSYTRRF